MGVSTHATTSGHFVNCPNTLKRSLTMTILLLWLNIREHLSTRRRSVFCHLLKEQSHKDLLSLRMNAHDMQLIDHIRCRSGILQLHRLV